jgi:hypothetical protein
MVHTAGTPVAGAPDDVGLAVAIEIASAVDAPFVADHAENLIGLDVRPIHLPDRDRAVIGPPQNVVLAVAVDRDRIEDRRKRATESEAALWMGYCAGDLDVDRGAALC